MALVWLEPLPVAMAMAPQVGGVALPGFLGCQECQEVQKHMPGIPEVGKKIILLMVI